jgi:hypothetical protein
MRSTPADARPTVVARFVALARELGDVGFVRPGSLVTRYMPCGRPTCRCQAQPPALHGPYFQWTHKIDGKTVTQRLSRAQALRCREWIRNHRQLKATIRKMETLSLQETDRILRTIGDESRADRS